VAFPPANHVLAVAGGLGLCRNGTASAIGIWVRWPLPDRISARLVRPSDV